MIGYCNVSSSALPNTFSDHISSVPPISIGKTKIAPVWAVRSDGDEGGRTLCIGREIDLCTVDILLLELISTLRVRWTLTRWCVPPKQGELSRCSRQMESSAGTKS
jgi:hypothetical protein